MSGDQALQRPDRLALAGVSLVAVFAVMALAAPLLATHDPALIDAMRRLEEPSREHLFGTDNLGRDTFSRIIHGSRWSLGTVAISTALIMSIGVAVGTAAGYFGGLVDEILMRVVDVLLAFPSLLLALAIAGTIGPGLTSVIAALVSVWWASYARIVRGMVLSIREREFIQAARGLGASDLHIVLRHILPNILAPVAILATVEMEIADADLLITSGGVSAGAYEVVKDAFSDLGTVSFVKVAMQPGGPQGWGRVGAVPVVTLPGNPVSAFVSFEVFVRPVLRAAMGMQLPDRPRVQARLIADVVSPAGKRQFLRGFFAAGQVSQVGGPGSHLLAHLARANCLVVIPEDTEQMAAGDTVDVWLLEGAP